MDGWIELYLECPKCEEDDYFEVKIEVSRGIKNVLDVVIYNNVCECKKCKNKFEAYLDDNLDIELKAVKSCKGVK